MSGARATGWPCRTARRAGRTLAALAGLAGGLGALVVGTPTVAAAYPTSTVVITGHGWGHGIGMGQWGALGYAIGDDNGDGNWTWQQIVTHFYGGTTIQTLGNDSQNVSVAMTENNGNDIIATAPGGVSVPGGPGSAPAVLFQPSTNGTTWSVYTGAGCGGTNGSWGAPVATGVTLPTTTALNGGPIQLCLAKSLYLHGTLLGTYNSNAAARTVNLVSMAQYLGDVVPSESSSGWGTLGGSGPQGEAWGFQELEAQAVAARSYVLSTTPGGYGGYADTCDQTCQSYPGIVNESPLATLAVTDTAGQVMELPGGQVADTEYSASTGGYTQGNQFPAVPDDGDAVCVPGACNPNHDWTAQVPVSSIEAAWPQLGTLVTITVTARTGLGAFGGRVNTISVVGTNATVNTTGPGFTDTLGLKSDFFTLGGTPSGGVGGYLLSAADGGVFAFGNAVFDGSMGGQPLNQPMVGMAETPDHGGYWQVAADGGIFSFGDAHFYGSTGSMQLNKPVVGMAATPDGGGYWLVASDGGIFSFGDAHFYGSTGSMQLNKPVVGMAATPDGGGYWLVASDGGIFSFGDAHFYGSAGALALAQPVVAMAATPDGGGYWMVATDGGIFDYGDAPFEGSLAGTSVVAGSVAVVPTHTGQGYLVVTGSGRVTNFGDAPQFGDLTTALTSYGGHVVGAAATPG